VAIARRRRRLALGRLALSLFALGVLVLGMLFGAPGSGGGSRAAAQTGGAGETSAQTDASVPARLVTMIGSSPGEAPEETWGLGQDGGAAALVRYTPETGWTPGPALLDSSGAPLSGFELDRAEGFQYPQPNPLAGQMTADGAGVLAGCTECKTVSPQQMLLVRNPGGAFQETAPLPTEGEAALGKGEHLLGNVRAPLVAAIEESGAQAGALVVPVNEEDRTDKRVLHWDGKAWTSEPIEVPAASTEEFQVLGISASAPEDAWLIARLSSNYAPGSVALFRRELGGGGEPTTWRPVKTTPEGEAGEALSVPTQPAPSRKEEPFTVPSRYQSQVLTATGEGVWIDGERTGTQSTVTMFFKPNGSQPAGEVRTAWCNLPQGGSATPCERNLPEALPLAFVRSFAWAEPSASEGLGERVITGFDEGVSLRLEDGQFKRVLALGGGLASQSADVGGSFGSAFSNAHEGWLGQELLPVHLTLHPLSSRLESWPVPFHHALLALAPQPGVPVGSPSSEVLAVGVDGEVARYAPGKGWLPETLLGPSGRHETPPLRAVAWPTPTRAYAVGDWDKETVSQMWLWRGETGLWEADPATPPNFRGNLLGIAFDPNEPARGYAVGQDGVLLSYGKTWSQEPPEALPPQVVGASFTSIAFAGSEAIVAYRKLVLSTQTYEGGLIVNDGSGWRIDEGAAKAMGADVPWAVAALADGGAAFGAEGGHILERQSAGAAWQEAPTPYPGDGSPGSLAALREGGVLRVIATGSVPETIKSDLQPSPPPGAPPVLDEPYPLESNQERGVLRQTATGWSDEEHELNNVQEPPGGYSVYDSVYQPDAVGAVLVNAAGSQGWAVGGNIGGQNPQADTSDVWRYPAEGSEPIQSAPIDSEPGNATIAIGGGARCEAPCADRALAKIGPDVWLSNAIEEAKEKAGARAFFYTGPRVTTGRTSGPPTLAIPYEEELERYGELDASPITSTFGSFAAASPTELDLARNEQQFGREFSRLPFADRELCETGAGGGACYYSVLSTPAAGQGGGPVKVIVLDDSEQGEVGQEQLKWLKEQLSAAEAEQVAAIVVGNADVGAQIATGGPVGERAVAVREALAAGNASAYFFDSPEQNVKLPMLAQSGKEVPSFGSGTLGYVSHNAQESSGFLGASGFLLVEVGPLNATHVAPVKVKLIPDIGELALEAKDGTLLQRSHAADFDALARRPRSGNDAGHGSTTPETNPYIPIPDECIGIACAHGILPEYEFISSNHEKGEFVRRNEASANQPAVLLGPNGKPIPDPTGKDALFCAYNPGVTEVTVIAGRLKATLPVTIEAGSVRQPCGTTPVSKPPSSQQPAPVPTPAPAPTPAGAAPASSSPPPIPLPLPPPAVTPPASRAVPPPPFFLPPAPLSALIPFVPPPVPTPARPTPPSGTSAVTSPVEAPEREEEQEAAPESVSNEAVAYRASEHEPAPEYILGIVLLAALAGASATRRPSRRRRELRVAPATITAMRAEQQAARRRRIR
jgi:hypothetical protein